MSEPAKSFRVLFLGGSHDGLDMRVAWLYDHLRMLRNDVDFTENVGPYQSRDIEEYALYWPILEAPLYVFNKEAHLLKPRISALMRETIAIEPWVSNRLWIADRLDKAWLECAKRLARVCHENRVDIQEGGVTIRIAE